MIPSDIVLTAPGVEHILTAEHNILCFRREGGPNLSGGSASWPEQVVDNSNNIAVTRVSVP